MPIYNLKNQLYNIPNELMDSFENDNPDATISYKNGNDIYRIPASKRKEFVQQFPDASLYEEQTNQYDESRKEGDNYVGGVGTQEEADAIFEENMRRVQQKYNQPQTQQLPDSEIERLKTIRDNAQIDIDSSSFFDRFFNADTRAAVAARDEAEEALEMYSEANRRKDGWFEKNVEGVLRGFFDKFGDLRTWDFGASGVSSAVALKDASEKLERGESLTPAEQNMLDAYGLSSAVQAAYQDKVGTAYRVGGSLPESLAFGASLAINPVGGAGRKIAETAAKAAVKKYGTGLVSKLAKGAARVGGDIVEMGVATAVPGAARVAEDYYNRLNGQSTFDIDNNGIIRYGGQVEQEEADDAIWKAFGSQFIENYSEAMGNYFAPMGTMLSNLTSKGLKAAHLGKLSEAITDISSSQWSKGLQRFKDAVKFDGLVGEYLEEVAGNFMNAATVGDMNFNSPEDPRSVFNPDTNIETFLSCALLSGTMYAVEAPITLYNKHTAKKNLRNADKAASEMLGGRWEDLRNQMDSASPEHLAQILTGVQNAADLSEEQKAAAKNYGLKLAQYQGYNARMVQNAQESTAETNEANNAYNEGSENDSPQYVFVANRERTRAAEALKAVDENVASVIDTALETGESVEPFINSLDENVAPLARDYYNKSMRLRGVIDGVMDRAEDVIAEEERIIRSVTDPSTGLYTEISRLVTDERGERVPQPGYVVGWIGEGENRMPTFLPEGAENIPENRVSLKPAEFDASSIQYLPMEDVISLNAEMIRERAQKDLKDKSSMSEQVYNYVPANGDQVTDENGQVLTITNISPDGVEYLNGEGRIEQMPLDDWKVLMQAQLDANEAAQAESIKVEESNQAIVDNLQSKPMDDGTGRVMQPKGVQGDKVVYDIADANGTVLEEGSMDAAQYNEVNTPETSGENVSSVEEVKPIGRGLFGEIYDQFKGKVKEGVNFLIKKRSGVLQGAFNRKEVGDIDLAWGNTKAGLAHIITKHVINQDDFSSVDNAVSTIEDVVTNGDISIQKDGRVAFSKDGYRVAIDRNEDGNWIVTALDTSRKQKEKKRSEQDATRLHQSIFGEENGELVSPQSASLSENKDSESNVQSQEKEQKPLHEREKSDVFRELGDRYGEKMPNKVAVTAKAFAEDVAKAQTKLDKAQEAYDNAPIGREEKAKNALDKAQQELDAIKREADFWAEMDAEIKSAQLRRSEILNPQAQTEATNEPMTADEFVAQQLAAGNIVLNKDDYMREIGYGSEEANAMNGGTAKMFNEKGMTIKEAGDRLEEMAREEGLNFFDATSGRDALISVLGSVKSRKELNQYIANNRAEQAKRDAEAVRNELEKSVMDANYSSLEDYVLQMEADKMENPFADVDLDRIDAIFAEAEEEYQNFINDEQGRTSEIIEGNDNVLSEEQSDNTGRTEGIEDEGNSDGNGEGTLQQNEEAHAGEVVILGEAADKEIESYREKVRSWLSEDNLQAAIEMTRDETFEKFGNTPEPIAYIPLKYLSIFGEDVTDNHLYCGKGYFIDHAANHHPEVKVDEYDLLQDVLSNPDAIKHVGNSIAFTRMHEKGFAVLVQLSNERGKIILHKSMFWRDKGMPYKNKKDVEVKPLVGGRSTISPNGDSIAGRLLSALNGNTNIANYIVPQKELDEILSGIGVSEDKKGEIIAELSEPAQSETASDVSKPQIPDNGGKESLNAETATISDNKDSNLSENNKENQENVSEFPLSESEYADRRSEELIRENPDMDDVDAYNQALDEYPSYIGGMIRSGYLEDLYAKSSIKDRVTLGKIVQSAGFETSDISKKSLDESKSNKHSVGEKVIIRYLDGSLVEGVIEKADKGKITVRSVRTGRVYNVSEDRIVDKSKLNRDTVFFRDETPLQYAERIYKEERRRKPLRERAKQWSDKLGVKVKIMERLDDVTNPSAKRAISRGQVITGWFEESTGEVCLYMPNITSESEVDSTYIHEVVAHKGLRGLLVDKFDSFCDEVWDMMSDADRLEFSNYPGVSHLEGKEKSRAAADEYIAHIAENIDVTESVWSKLTELVKKFLKAIGIEPKMTNADIANTIKKSYQRLLSGVGAEGNVSGEGTRFSAKRTSDRRQEMNRVNNTVDQALSLVYGKDIKEIRKERQEQEQKRKEDAAEIYQSVLSGDFNDVTLQKINDYIDDATPLHPYGRRISQRLPQKLERGLHEGARTNAVDALFSRICESAVPASRRASEAGRREIEERKKEALKGWAIATNNWHTDLSDFADEADFIRQGTDSKVYLAKDGKHVIKVSFGKPEGKRFRPDIDTTALFNSVFRNTAYEIVGYGEFDGKFARILKQPFVDFADKTALNAEEREEYMRTLGFDPINESKTAFSNGSIVAADLQKSNILKDAAGNISVIDADMKLHTKDVGGNYTYPPVEADLPEGTRFRIAYHGSAADFDKFSKDFIGSGEGQAVMGHGFYVTTSEGTSEYYANVASENKRKIVQEGGYTFNGEVIRDRALVSAYELLKDNGFDAEKAIEKANHRIEIFKKRKGIFANTATTEKAIEYLESEKNNPGSIGYQEEIIEKPSRIKYEVEIPDDTGKNYLDLDKKATKKFKDESKKRMIEILDNGEESSYWKKNRDIINDEWKFVDRSDATNDTVRGTMEQFISQEEVANVFSSMGYVGSKSKASDGTTYIIYNEDDIEIKDSTRFRFIGERGARNLDKAEEATTRLDNLAVARDMEAAFNAKKERVEKLKDSEPVEITGDEIPFSEDLKQYKKNALEYGKSLQGEYINKDTGSVIQLQRGRKNGGLNEVLQHNYKDKEHIQSVAAIPQIIEEGIYISYEANKEVEKNPDVAEYQHFVCGLNIGGEGYTVHSIVAVDKKGNRYYDHNLIHIEKGNLLDSLIGTTPGLNQEDSKNGFGTTPGTKLTTNSEYKYKRLISILQTNDKENAKKIKMATGWERGADGKWRYEVDDNISFDTLGERSTKLKKAYSDAQEKYYRFESRVPSRTPKNATEEEKQRIKDLRKELAKLRKEMRKAGDAYYDSPIDNTTLGDFIGENNNLFKEYPELKDVGISFVRNARYINQGFSGFYDPESNSIWIDDWRPKGDIRSSLIHEIQHAIQHIEGFSWGGSTAFFEQAKEEAQNRKYEFNELINKFGFEDWEKNIPIEELMEYGKKYKGEFGLLHLAFIENAIEDKYVQADLRDELESVKAAYNRFYEKAGGERHSYKTPRDWYLSLGGEVEARNVQQRMGMTDEQRRNTLASETEDVAREDQIFLNGALEEGTRFRLSDKGRKIQNEVDKFAEKYNSKETFLLDLEMTDEELDSVVPELTNDGLKEILENNPGITGGYSSKTDKIYIFVENQALNDLEDTMFHENLHQLLDNEQGLVESFFKVAAPRFPKNIEYLKERGYDDKDIPEELFVRLAAKAMDYGIFDDVVYNLPEDAFERYKELIKEFGYGYRQEIKSRVLGKGRRGTPHLLEGEEIHETRRTGRNIRESNSEEEETAREQAERLGNLFGQVADMGLDGVLGNKAYTSAMVDIYKELPQDVRTSLADDALRHYKGSIAPAVSDYLNHNAEASIWDKVVGIIRQALRKVGFDVDLNTNDVKYILWRSQKKLDRNNLIDVAEDIDKKYRLKVGEYNGSPTRFREVDRVNEKFNEDLSILNEENADKVELNLGRPSAILRAAGVEDKPMKLYGNKVIKKMKKHGFSLDELRDLPNAVADPIAVFDNLGRDRNRSILTELKTEQGNFLVTVDLGKKKDLDFNIISSVFGKSDNKVVGWINKGYATYINKEKALEYLYYPAPIAETPKYQELDSATKIVESFENPKVEGENVRKNGGGTRFRVDVGNKLNIRDEYEATIKKGSYQSREAVQDAMLSLRRVQELIEKATGKKLRDFENAWMHENRLSSVVQSAIHEMERKFYKPMMDAVKKLMDSASLEQNEVADYLMLKHGIERNREMAVRKALTDSEGKIDRDKLNDWYEEKRRIRKDASLDTWRKKQEAMDDAALMFGADMSRDYSGLTSMFDTDDLADCTERAYDEVEALENLRPAETEALGKAVKAMTQSSLDKSFQSGLMDKKVYDELSNDMYDYYIPLRGFEETTSDEVYAYLDNERNAFNAPLMRAKGRTSKSDNPLAYMKSIAESGIMQGERNKMKQTFLNMVINNPSDLVSVKEGVWAVYNPATGEWEAASFPESLVPRNATPADVDAAYQQWEADMEQRSQQYPNVKKVSEAEDVPYRVIGNRMNQHQVIVKRLGKSYTLTINGNPRLAMALNGLTNPNNTSNDGKVSAFVSGKIDALNRTLSAWYTTRNPDFVASNFMRDTFYTNTIVRAKEGNRYANQFHKYYAKLLKPGKMLSLFYKYENGTLDASKPVEKDFLDFMMNGGETGYSNLKDLEHIKKQISKELKGDRLAMFTKAAEKLDLLNRAVENTARFAAFRTSRRMGRTIAKSVFDAKEISVNFNKKGSGGTFFGATGQTTFGNLAAMVGAGGRAFYVFFNAAIQGTTNLMHVMKVNPMGTGAGIGAMFLMGAVIPYLFAGDDDDEKDYYDLPEHVRRNHLIIPGTGDAWVSIPLPIEYRIMYGMGELLTSWRTGHERGENIGRKMFSLTGQALPLNFLEEGFDAFMPSALSPVWQIYNNESWTGLPIYKDTDFNKQDPEYTKAYKNVDRLLYNFSKAMYEWTFDEENQKARIDLNPAMMETLARGYFGGLATQLSNLGKTYETIAGEREFDWRSIPVANRLFKTGDERTKEKRITNEYFDNIEKLEFLQSRKRLLKKTKDGAAVPEEDKLRAEEDFKIMEGTDVYKKYMDFNDKKKKVDKVYRKRKEKDSKELETKYYNLMEEANRAVKDL